MGSVQKGPVALIIMDGVGLNPSKRGNAVIAASTPNLLHLYKTYPHAKLAASGEDVGLMPGQLGDSNVGHLNIGAGRVGYQYALRIQNEIKDGSFFENEALKAAVEGAAASGRRLHLMGLVSDGGVHSHVDHLVGILRMAKQAGCKDVFVHAFTDGRDVPPTSGQQFVADLEATMRELGLGRVATVSGRYFAMDRDRRWERTQRAYDAMVLSEGEAASDGAAAVAAAYERGETDEFISPTVIRDAEGKAVGPIQDGDSIIFFNFRAERPHQINRGFTQEDFVGSGLL